MDYIILMLGVAAFTFVSSRLRQHFLRPIDQRKADAEFEKRMRNIRRRR